MDMWQLLKMADENGVYNIDNNEMKDIVSHISEHNQIVDRNHTPEVIGSQGSEENQIANRNDTHEVIASQRSEENESVDRNDTTEVIASQRSEENLSVDTNQIDKNNALIEVANEAENTNPKVSRCVNWTFQASFTLNFHCWNNLHNDYKLSRNYGQYFIKYMNENLGLSCILKTRGAYRANKLFILRFKCTCVTCPRVYKVHQIASSNFKIYNNTTTENHVGLPNKKQEIVEKSSKQKNLQSTENNILTENQAGENQTAENQNVGTNNINDGAQTQINDENQTIDIGTSDIAIQDNVKSIKQRIQWKFQKHFTLDPHDWDNLHDDDVLRPTYAEFFVAHINHNLDVSCVLRARGPYRANGLFVLRFECTNGHCTRQYKISELEDYNFIMYSNSVAENHNGQERCRPIRGVKRQIVAKATSKMHPEDYLLLCQTGISKTLFENGNLQDLVSTGTVQKIRSIAITKNLDFDKDDIIDLLKMKILADIEYLKSNKKSDIFIRRLNLDPFAVLMYSNAQLELVKLLSNDDEYDVIMHFDATGSVARHSLKRVFYYAAVARVKKNRMDEKEKARLQPLLEFLSGEHDAHNIRLLLEDYRKDYETKYPTLEWPIQYAVTDFSFALLNGLCRAWNCMKLITYINFTYKFANHTDFRMQLRSLGIQTLLRLCCGHLSKTYANDVSKYFPSMESSNQAILKEIFCAMFDISSLDILRSIWVNLSTLLLSKYVNDTVESALKNLTEIIFTDASKKRDVESNDDEEEEEKEEYPLPDDTVEHLAIYKQSLYYQDFLPVSYKPQFEVQATSLNQFYSVEFSNVFLRKYVSILCLWTCIAQKTRISNAPGESHFKCTKSRIKRRESEIGAAPLKSGRLCRELEKYTEAVTTANLMKIPRKNNCYKQKSTTKSINEAAQNNKVEEPGQNNEVYESQQNDHHEASMYQDESYQKSSSERQSILALYRSAPKPKTPASNRRSTSKSTPKSTRRSTSKSTPRSTRTSTSKFANKRKLQFDLETITEDDVPIDDQSVQEQWFKRRKIMHSYMNKEMLKNVKESSQSQLKKMLERKLKNSSKVVVPQKMKNYLIDNPDIYLKPKENFVVSRIGEVILMKIDYELLARGTLISRELFRFIWSLFKSEAPMIQFELLAISNIVKKIRQTKVLKVNKSIIIGIDIELFTLFIIDCKEKTFSCVHPNESNYAAEETYFHNFMEFVCLHNSKHPEHRIPDNHWKVTQFHHQLQQSTDDSTIFILNYIQQYISNKKIDAEIKTECYRKELQNLILWKSSYMKNRCVMCGLGNLPQKNTETLTDWVYCNNCGRLVHDECIGVTEEEVADESVNYFCIICDANTVKNVDKATKIHEAEEPNESSTATEQNLIEDLDFLEDNVGEWDDVKVKWKTTTRARLDILETVTIEEYFQKFPCLKCNRGWELYTIDVQFLYPNIKSIQSLDNFTDAILDRVKSVKAYPLSHLLVHTGKVQRSTLALLSLPYFCPSKINGKSIRLSKAQISTEFFSWFETKQEFDEHQLQIEKYSEKKHFPVPPSVHSFGSFEQLISVITIGTESYFVDNPLVAFESYFHMFFALNLEYPKASAHIWLFVQKNFFEITTACDPKIPSVENLLKSF